MPGVSKYEQALDWVASNPQRPESTAIMQSIGVGAEDVKAWQWVKTNPDAPLAVQVKNKIFEKVATTAPPEEIQRVSRGERFKIQNLLDNAPELQEVYLQRKGYETKRDDSGRLLIRKPEDASFGVVDPKGFDLWDVTDVAGDVLDAVVETGVTGLKAVGAATGPGLLPAMGVAGAIGAGFETGKQALAKGMGLRDEMDPALIAKEGALRAGVPAVFRGLGKVAGKAVDVTGDFFRKARQPAADAVEEAAEIIGAKPTAGQIFKSRSLQQVEASQTKKAGSLGGMFVRNRVEENFEAAQKVANDLVKIAGGKSPTEAGEQVGAKLTQELSERLAPAEKLYDEFTKRAKFINVDKTKVTEAIEKLKTRFEDDPAASVLNFAEKRLQKITKVDQLKELRTDIGGMLEAGASKNKRKIVSTLYSAITDARSTTLIKANPTAKAQIEQADAIYRSAIVDLSKAIKGRGGRIKLSPNVELAEFLEKTVEAKRIDKILKTGDPKAVAALEQAFPETFEILRAAKVQEFVDDTKVKGVVSVRALAKRIDSLEPETARLIFGAEGQKKAQALKTFLDSIPDDINPSGTGYEIWIQSFLHPWQQAYSVAGAAWRKILQAPEYLNLFSKAANKVVQSPITRATGFYLLPRTIEGLQIPREPDPTLMPRSP